MSPDTMIRDDELIFRLGDGIFLYPSMRLELQKTDAPDTLCRPFLLMKKKRLLVNALPLVNVNTGIGRYLREVYLRLEKHHGHELDIRYFDGKQALPTMPAPPTDTSGWSRKAELFWKLPPRAALAVRIAVHALRQARFTKAAREADIYHEPAFFPFKTPATVKTVFTIHDMSLERFPEHHPAERVLFHKRFFRPSLQRCSAFISVSEFTKNEFSTLTGIPEQMVTVTPLAHNPDVFFPAPAEQTTAVMKKFSLPERYFLFVGGGDPRKNLATVPPAVNLAVPDAVTAVTGWTGWTKNKVRGKVISLGHVEDHELAALYSGALALIFPSEYEGFGLPILEATACGCPVVATRRASLPEVAGDAALYVENPFDENEFAGVLTEIVADTNIRRQCIEKGFRRSKEFSWDRTAEQTRDCLIRTLEDHS